jgi:hypothetical protein
MERREQSKPKTKERATENTLLRLSDWMVKTQCAACNATIDDDQDRIVLAAVAFRSWEDRDGHLDAFRDEQKIISYCMFCADSIDELRMPNSWRRVDPATLSKSAPEPEYNLLKALKVESVEADRKIAKGLVAGDMHPFNKAMPTNASKEDMMGHFISHQGMAADIAERGEGEEGLNASETADALTSTLPITSPLARIVSHGHAPASKVDATHRQKEKLRDFLASPRSKGMRPQIRNAARRWIDGASHNEIAKSMGVDQSTVSRNIKTALDLANKPI